MPGLGFDVGGGDVGAAAGFGVGLGAAGRGTVVVGLSNVDPSTSAGLVVDGEGGGGAGTAAAPGRGITVGTPVVGVASVSAPVYDDRRLVAAVSVSGPVERTSRAPGRRYAHAVVDAARAVETALATG